MSVLRDMVRVTEAKRVGAGWLGKCVSHDDSSPSLSMREENGKILVNCHTGCSFESIRTAFSGRGIQIFEPKERDEETVYTIRDESGTPLAQHVRIDTPEGKKVFWRGPRGEKTTLQTLGLRLSDLPLYGIHSLPEQSDYVVVTEGEKAADALRRIGVPSVGTVTGASSAPSANALASLRGRRVILWPDNDDPGRKHMATIASTLSKLRIEHETLSWPDAPSKGDAADFVAHGGKEADFKALLQGSEPSGLVMLADGIKEAVADMDRFDAGDFSALIQTGIVKLDRRLRGGLRPGQLTLLGAPTGGGKTTIIQQIVSYAAQRGPVLFVTPEMSAAELAEREIVRRSGRELWDRNPWIHVGEGAKEFARMAHAGAASEIVREKLPIYLIDRTDVTMIDVEQMASKIRGLVLVAIDYAQQVADISDERRPRYLQVGDVGTRSITLAQRLSVPVVVASQVNVVKDGAEKTFAFRETAILEHKAHNVLIFDVDWEEGEQRQVKSARILCTKQRSGKPFRLDVYYRPETYTVSDVVDSIGIERRGGSELRALPFTRG